MRGLRLGLSLAGITDPYGPELVVNGVGTDLTGWTQGGDGVFSIVANRFRIQSGAGNSWSTLHQAFTVEIGASYRFQGTAVAGTAQGLFLVGNSPSYGQYVNTGNGNVGDFQEVIVPTQTTIYITMMAGYPGGYKDFSSVSLRKVL